MLVLSRHWYRSGSVLSRALPQVQGFGQGKATEMNTPWQDVICNAAVDSTLKGNENLVFRLKWKDLRSLCGELGSLDLAEDKPEGIAISARVWCYALRRQVIVNEWVGESRPGV